MNYIIFGGSGFIGTHLIHLLKNECLKPNDKIYDLDIVMPGEEGVVPGIVEKNDDVEYIRLDVRKTIEFGFKPTKDDVIFNLAAVHRTPGHPDYAYFETNIYGAENVTAFAEKHGIRKILFTSSIAPYGAAEELKTEDKVNDFWHPNDEGGMAWNDPEIGIEWPELKGEYKGSASAEGYKLEDGTALNLSDKDQKWLGLKDTFKF